MSKTDMATTDYHMVGCLFNPVLKYQCSPIQVSCQMPSVWEIKCIKSFENQQIIKKDDTQLWTLQVHKLMAICKTTWTYSGKPYIFAQYKIQNTRMTHSTNHRRIAFSSFNRNHDTTSFSQFLIAPNLLILLKLSFWLLRYKLIVIWQLFANETLGRKPISTWQR